jgi:hypothetical protein
MSIYAILCRYFCFKLAEATCIFRRVRPVSHSTRNGVEKYSAGAGGRLRVLLVRKGELRWEAQPSNTRNGAVEISSALDTIEHDEEELVFLADALVVDPVVSARDAWNSRLTRCAQLRFIGPGAGSRHPFLNLFSLYEIHGATIASYYPTVPPECAAAARRPPQMFDIGDQATVEPLRYAAAPEDNVVVGTDPGRIVALADRPAQSPTPSATDDAGGPHLVPLEPELPHFEYLAPPAVRLGPVELGALRTFRKQVLESAAAQLSGVASLLMNAEEAPNQLGGPPWDDLTLVSVVGVVIKREVRTSDNMRWAPTFRAEQQDTMLLELGQVGASFDTIKVYIDLWRSAAAPPMGLLPGTLVILRQIELATNQHSGARYGKYLHGVSSLSIGARTSDLRWALGKPALAAPGVDTGAHIASVASDASDATAVGSNWHECRPRHMLGNLAIGRGGGVAMHVNIVSRLSCRAILLRQSNVMLCSLGGAAIPLTDMFNMAGDSADGPSLACGAMLALPRMWPAASSSRGCSSVCCRRI